MNLPGYMTAEQFLAQSWQPFVPLGRSSTPMWNILPESEEAFQALFPSCLGSLGCNNLSFTLDGMLWHAPDHWNSKNVTDVTGP